MTIEQKHTNLVNHVANLCAILNKNGFKDRSHIISLEDEEVDYRVDKEDPEVTFGIGICDNKRAFHYLKENGHLDIGVCWKCGQEPIDNKCSFSEGNDPSIKFFICNDCRNEGLAFQGQVKRVVSGEKSSNCYIATACYGNINACEVTQLRTFRDEKLCKSFAGRVFIKFYYFVSPCVASKLEGQAKINNLIRRIILNRIVRKISK